MPRGQISIIQLCKPNYAFLHVHSTVEKGKMYKANAQIAVCYRHISYKKHNALRAPHHSKINTLHSTESTKSLRGSYRRIVTSTNNKRKSRKDLTAFARQVKLIRRDDAESFTLTHGTHGRIIHGFTASPRRYGARANNLRQVRVHEKKKIQRNIPEFKYFTHFESYRTLYTTALHLRYTLFKRRVCLPIRLTTINNARRHLRYTKIDTGLALVQPL